MPENISVLFEANAVFIIVAAILLFFTVSGYRKGLIKMVVSFLSVFITLFLVIAILPGISESLMQTELYEKLRQKTTAEISQMLQNEFSEDEMAEFTDEEQIIQKIMDKLHLPKSMQGYVQENITLDGGVLSGAKNQFQIFADKVAELILKCGIFMLSYILILVVVKLLFAVINLISMLPVIHGANKLAGMLLGIVEGICVVWVFFILVTTFGGAELNTTLFPQIENNQMLLFLYENNPLLKYVMK